LVLAGGLLGGIVRQCSRMATPLPNWEAVFSTLEWQIMTFTISITKPEITELSRRSGIPIPRELQLQLENQETVCLSSELQLSHLSQFRLAKAILSSLEGLGSALSYGQVA